jgi:hypothetical protein
MPSRELLQKIEALKTENAKLRAALQQVEWVWTGTSKQGDRTELICPWCKNAPDSIGVEYSRRGHKPDCLRQAALSPNTQQEGESK